MRHTLIDESPTAPSSMPSCTVRAQTEPRVPSEPTQSGRVLRFENVSVPASGESTVQLLLAVGAGVTDGNYSNRAQAISSLSGLAVSGEAAATVQLAPDPDLACTDVMGKVFDDKNRNQMQDAGELGLAGVRPRDLRHRA